MKENQKLYTKVHYNFDELPWLTSPRKQLDLEAVAIGLIRLPADEGYTFLHNHREQEEVYIVISGSGRMQIDRNLIPIETGDIVRVGPPALRALKAGPQGLFVLCAGGVSHGYPKNPNARYLIDDGVPHYDEIPLWYQGRGDIRKQNEVLRRRSENRKIRRAKQPE